jgi:S-layer homology domain
MNAEYLDVPVNHTLQSYIHTLTKNGVMVGGSSGKFFPDNTLTRAEIARMFYKTFFGGKR